MARNESARRTKTLAKALKKRLSEKEILKLKLVLFGYNQSQVRKIFKVYGAK